MMDTGAMKMLIDDDFAKESGKRRVGRPRKTDEEKKQNRKEYNAKYWKENKEKISKQRKKRYQENKKKIDERNKQWIENNRKRWNEYMRERRKNNGKRDKCVEQEEGTPKA